MERNLPLWLTGQAGPPRFDSVGCRAAADSQLPFPRTGVLQEKYQNAALDEVRGTAPIPRGD
jgi:hypothetical protein